MPEQAGCCVYRSVYQLANLSGLLRGCSVYCKRMYTQPLCDVLSCDVYSRLSRYAEAVCSEPEGCCVPAPVRHRLCTIVGQELKLAHERLFKEWWNPNTVYTEFFNTVHQLVISELAYRVPADYLDLLLQRES